MDPGNLIVVESRGGRAGQNQGIDLRLRWINNNKFKLSIKDLIFLECV